MKDEIKEILDNFKIYEDRYKKCNETQFIIFYRDIHLLLDYITNLQEQLHQASLDIQELIEKDIGCPSWCDKLTNLQKENEKLTAESTQWEERTYCWQDTSSNLQIKIDKAVEVLKLCNSKCSKEVINILNGDDE